MIVLRAESSGLHSIKQLRNIKNGDVVQIKVLRSSGDNNWQISIKGKLLTVFSEVPLRQGQFVKVRAFWSKNQLTLKIFDTGKGTYSFSGIEIPKNSLSEAIMQAFQRSTMPLEPEKIAFLYRLLQKKNITSKEAIRFFVLALDKGISPDEESFFNEILPKITGEGEGQGSGQNSGSRQNNHEDKKEKEEKHPLMLFNHKKSNHGHWLIIPYSCTVNSLRLEGTIRCCFRNEEQAKRKNWNLNMFSSVVWEVRCRSDRWFFSINPEKDGNPMEIFSTIKNKQLRKTGDALGKFKEKLRNLSVVLDDTIKELGNFDGFSGESPGSYKKIDTLV